MLLSERGACSLGPPSALLYSPGTHHPTLCPHKRDFLRFHTRDLTAFVFLTDFSQHNDLKARSGGTNGRILFSFVTEQRLLPFPFPGF